MKSIKIFKDKDVKGNLLKDRKIGIIGYGNQGRAQALNLKDSGLNVKIGLRKSSQSRKQVELDGFKVISIDCT